MTTTPQAARLSESEIVACIAKAGCIGTVKMSYESGPYDIDRPSINASRLYDAIEVAILAKLQAATPAEPAQSKCLTCNGHGLIGGHMQDGSGYGEGCPDCNPEPSHADPIEIERKQRQAAVARFVDENRSRQTEPVQTWASGPASVPIEGHTMTTTPQAALLSAQEIEEMALQEQFLLVCDGLDELTCIVRAVESAILANLQATQEPVQSVPEAMKVVTEALRSDPNYAWSWHCNVAMASVDEGMGHYEANQAAARFMYSLAGVDTTKHQGFPEAPKQEPVQVGELPDERAAFERWWRRRQLLTFPNHYAQRRLADWCDAYKPAAKDAWQARAALSARKPLTDEQRAEVFRAAENRMVHAINLSWRDAVVAEVERAHGIGLEVKP